MNEKESEQILTSNNGGNGVERKRLMWLDAARGIGILLVLLGHTSPSFGKFIYGFHMPLFFIISGFLYK